jgi:hypothetical protein
MKRARIFVWQSVVISVATAAAAVAIYDAVFVPGPAPAPSPQVVVQRIVEPSVCPEPRIEVRSACPDDPEELDMLPANTTARARFEYAVDLLRNQESDAGCRVLEQVAVMQDEPWRAKAQGLIERRCD